MNKTTRIAGIDNKYGRKSRTGSTISMNISDVEAMECQQYLMDIEAGRTPSGRIKKIELIMYSEDDLKSEPNIVDSIETLDNALGGQTFEDYSKDESKLPTHEGNQRELDIYEDEDEKGFRICPECQSNQLVDHICGNKDVEVTCSNCGCVVEIKEFR